MSVNTQENHIFQLQTKVPKDLTPQESQRARLDALYELNQALLSADSQDGIIQPVLEIALGFTPAIGVSFLPLNERGHPLAAISKDRSTDPLDLETWSQYLAASSIQSQCKICGKEHPLSGICPLLRTPFSESIDLFCLHFKRDQRKFGVLNIYLPKGERIDQQNRALLQAAADAATLALESERLRKKERWFLSQLDNDSQENHTLPNHQAALRVKTILEERSRLAREIHDGLAQILGYVKLQLALLQNAIHSEDQPRILELLHSSYQATSEAYLDAREAIDDLHLDPMDGDFSSWLSQTTTEFEGNYGIPVHIQGLNPGIRFSSQIFIQLVRIIQEALSNIRKHAHTQEVSLSFQQGPDGTTLQIQDYGIGFDLQQQLDSNQHGLRSMHERARSIGVQLNLNSIPGQGTTIQIHLPSSIEKG
jgi:nitrate/nitrite-specific signal transduction histidine kinase